MKIRVARLRELIKSDVIREADDKSKKEKVTQCSDPPPGFEGYYCPRHTDKELCVEWGRSDKLIELTPEQEDARQREIAKLGGIQPPTKDRPDLMKPTKTKRGGVIRALWCPLAFEPGEYGPIERDKDGRPVLDENGLEVLKPNRFNASIGDGMACDYHVGVSVQGMGNFASKKAKNVKYPMLGKVAVEEGVLGQDAEIHAKHTRTVKGKLGSMEKFSPEDIERHKAAAKKAHDIRTGARRDELTPEEEKDLMAAGRYERMAEMPSAFEDLVNQMAAEGFHWKKKEGERVPERKAQEEEVSQPTTEDAIAAGIEDLTHLVNGRPIKSYKGKVKITMDDGSEWLAIGHESREGEWGAKPGSIDYRRIRESKRSKRDYSEDQAPFEKVPLEKDAKGNPILNFTQDDISYLGWWYPQQLAQAEKKAGRDYKGPKPYFAPRGKAHANVVQNFARLGWSMASGKPEGRPAEKLTDEPITLGASGLGQGEDYGLEDADIEPEAESDEDIMMPNPETKQQAYERGGREAVAAWRRDHPDKLDPKILDMVRDQGAQAAAKEWKPEVPDPDFFRAKSLRQLLKKQSEGRGPSLLGCVLHEIDDRKVS